MSKYFLLLSLGVILAAGCGPKDATTTTAPGAPTDATAPESKTAAAGGASAPTDVAAAPDWAKTGTPTGK